MHELDDLLPAALHDLADEAPHDPHLAEHVRRRARRGRLVAGAGVGVAAALAVVAVIAAATWGGARTASPPASRHGGVAVVPACSGTVVRGVLPEWARTGFSDPRPVMPYVRSASGDVVAILFGDPLTAPPRKDTNNKILWAWRTSLQVGDDVRLSARLDGTGPVVTAGLPAPTGPSIVDLPAAGCWRLTLTGPGGRSDTIDLRYVPRPQTTSR